MVAVRMAVTVPVLRLKPDREHPVLAGHPWVFLGAGAQFPHRQALDHPVSLNHPEEEYLKSLLLLVE